MSGLVNACRCHFCGTALATGAQVQWFRKAPRRAAKGLTLPARSVACCAGAFPGECEANRLADEREAVQQTIDAAAAKLAQIIARDGPDAALAFLAQGGAA